MEKESGAQYLVYQQQPAGKDSICHAHNAKSKIIRNDAGESFANSAEFTNTHLQISVTHDMLYIPLFGLHNSSHGDEDSKNKEENDVILKNMELK